MSGDVEFGKCDMCGKEAPLMRKYYYYDIRCECHGPVHFELVCHCADCKPAEPSMTNVRVSTKELRRAIDMEGGFNLRELYVVPDQSITDLDTIRYIALLGDSKLFKKVDPRFEIVGLYPNKIKKHNIKPDGIPQEADTQG